MAALPTASLLQTPSSPKPYLRSLLHSPNPNPNAFSSSLPRGKHRPISVAFVRRRHPPAPFPARCSSGHGEHEYEGVPRQRPQEIPWSKDLANSVHLIGIVGSSVQIKHLSSGKVLAWTRLGVKKSASETTWINLTFWDELAHMAFQHVEKGHQVHVSGRLVSDVVEGDDEKRQVFYKVVVQQLDFIERNYSTVSLYEPETRSVDSGAKFGSYVGNSSGSTEKLWQAFFANPVDWWDNRKNKRNPKYPDFKHKDTGEALWIDSMNNPHWVKSQLAILDSRMSSLHQADGTSPAVSFMYDGNFTPF
ncbi:hypothetical protein OPV22_031878 [Ensete ventricosum]|uniref:Single-stranded DNA-binding protein n=1 Tax=Ensete ventricosum TaxID=4639 RepID=A0AAV8PV18_ENSVE|nr:hypothetical protein OPV22_031878 [Ensete ventricosum]